MEEAPFHTFLFLFLSAPFCFLPVLSHVLLSPLFFCFITATVLPQVLFPKALGVLPGPCLLGRKTPLPTLTCSTHLPVWGRHRLAESPLQPGCTRTTPPHDPGGVLALVAHPAAIASTAPGPNFLVAAAHRNRNETWLIPWTLVLRARASPAGPWLELFVPVNC